jgi:hypothetical protein
MRWFGDKHRELRLTSTEGWPIKLGKQSEVECSRPRTAFIRGQIVPCRLLWWYWSRTLSDSARAGMRKISQVWKVFCEDAERRCRMGKRHIANRQVDKCKWALCVIGAGSYREVEVPPRPTFHCRVQKYPGLIVGLSLRLAVHHFRLFPSNPLTTYRW